MINRAGGISGAKDMYVYSTSLVDDAIKAQSSWIYEWEKLQHSIESTKIVLLSFIDGPGVLIMKTFNQVLKILKDLDKSMGHVASSSLFGGLGSYGILKIGKSIYDTVHAVDPVKQLFANLGKDNLKALELIKMMSNINAGDSPDKINKIVDILNNYTQTANTSAESTKNLKKTLKQLSKLQFKEMFSGLKTSLTTFIAANKLLLGAGAVISAGLYIWKKHEEKITEFNEQLKDSKKNLLTYQQLSLELSTEDRLTQTILAQSVAFTKLRGSISEAQFALSDILEKLADIKPIKPFLSEEIDSYGFSELRQKSLKLVMEKQSEDSVKAFKTYFEKEMKQWDENAINKQRIDTLYKEKKSIDPEIKRESILIQDMIENKAINLNKPFKISEADRKNYEVLSAQADYIKAQMDYFKAEKQDKDNASKEANIKREEFLALIGLSNEEYWDRLKSNSKNYNPLLKLDTGYEVNLLNDYTNTTNELKKYKSEVGFMNEILSTENQLRVQQIDSLRSFNSALNTYTEYYRSMVSKDVLNRIDNYNSEQVLNIVKSDSPLGKYFKQYSKTQGSDLRSIGIDPSIVTLGNEDLLKRAGEAIAIREQIAKAQDINVEYMREVVKKDKELQSLFISKGIKSNQDYINLLNSATLDKEQTLLANERIKKQQTTFNKNLSSVNSAADFNKLKGNMLSTLLGLTQEEAEQQFSEAIKKYNKNMSAINRNGEVDKASKKIETKLSEVNLNFSDYIKYLSGNTDGMSKEIQDAIAKIVKENPKQTELIRKKLNNFSIFIQDTSITFISSMFDSFKEKFISIFGQENLDKFAEKFSKFFKDDKIINAIQNQAQIVEQQNSEDYLVETINIDGMKDRLDKSLEDIEHKYNIANFNKEKSITLSKYKRLLNTGKTETTSSKIMQTIAMGNSSMESIDAQLSLLYAAKREVGLNDIELNKKIIELEKRRLSEFKTKMENLISQKNEVMEDIEQVFRNQDFNLNVHSDLKNLVYEKVKTIYSGISDDFIAIRENMQKQAMLYEKQAIAKQKYNYLVNSKDSPLNDKEKKEEIYKYAEQYNQSVAELFRLQNEMIGMQKATLEKNIVSGLENMSRRARGEDVQLDVAGARNRLAKALSSLAFKDQAKSPELLMVENSKSQLQILAEAKENLVNIEKTLYSWHKQYESISQNISNESLTPGHYGQFIHLDTNYKKETTNANGELANKLDKVIDKARKENKIDNTYGINKEKLLQDSKSKVKPIRYFEQGSPKNGYAVEISDKLNYSPVDSVKQEILKVFNSNNKDLLKKQNVYSMNDGRIIDQFGNYLGTVKQDTNKKYGFVNEQYVATEEEAHLALLTSGMGLENNQYVSTTESYTDNIQKAVAKGTAEGQQQVQSQINYQNQNTSKDTKIKLDTGELETKQVNAQKEVDYTNSMSKLFSLLDGLSAISVIIQDLRNADFSKKLEDLKETFKDQKVALERERNLAPTNAEKFEKEVEMWNLEARQQAELDTMTEENRIENELVAINQAIFSQSTEIIKHLSAISDNTSPNKFSDLFGMNTIRKGSGFSNIIDSFGNAVVQMATGETLPISQALTIPNAVKNIAKSKDISNGTVNTGFTTNAGITKLTKLQPDNFEFNRDAYYTAKVKAEKGEPLDLKDIQMLSYAQTNGGTLTDMGSFGDYIQSITGINSGIQNENIAEIGAGITNLGKTIGGTQTLSSINKFLNSNNVSKIANSALGKKFGLDTMLKSGKSLTGELAGKANATGMSNVLGTVGGGLQAVGGGLQIGQMIGTGKFDLGGAINAGMSLGGAASMLSGTSLAASIGGKGLVGAAAGKLGLSAGAAGGAALAGAIALPAIAVGAYASKQISRRKRAQALLKQNDVLREKEAEQYQKMLEALNAQKNPLLNSMAQQSNSVGYDEAMRRALMSAPLTASSSELFKDYQVSYRGGKLGTGRKRRKWVYSAVDSTVGIQDFGYNTISDISDSYGLLNNITAKMKELDTKLNSRGRDDGDRSQREEWAKWYATKEASQMLFDQVKDIQESMVKSLSTLTQAYFGFETIGLNKKGGVAQEGETIDRFTTGAWQERTNILNTFVQDFLKAGNTVGESIAKIFVEGASNAFVKNNTELNKIMNTLEDKFEKLANSFVNTDKIKEALDYELSSGSNDPEVYKSIFEQLKNAGYGTQKDYEQAQNALNDKNYKQFVELMKSMISGGNGSNQSIDELIKSLNDLEKVQEDLEKGMRDFVDQWVDGGGKLSDIIASMDNILSRSADLIADLLVNGDATAGLESFKNIITDKILPEIKDLMIDSMQLEIFNFEDSFKGFKDKLLSGNLSFSGDQGLNSFVDNVGNLMDYLSNPVGNLDALMNTMGGEELQKLLAYKNLMDKINEELYERMSIDEKIAYNQEKLNQEASKYKTQLAEFGFKDIGDLGTTSFKELERELQDLLAIPVSERTAEWEKAYETLRKKIELAKDQYGTLNDTILKLEEDIAKQNNANQQFSKAWLNGIIKGDYSTIRDELATETQDMMDSIINSMSSADWESGATSIGQSMASHVIDAYTNKLISGGQLKQASALLNDMMFENLNFVNSNGMLNFDMLYQLSQQSQKLAKLERVMVICANC